jgi:opacity protein-like surface antigen
MYCRNEADTGNQPSEINEYSRLSGDSLATDFAEIMQIIRKGTVLMKLTAMFILIGMTVLPLPALAVDGAYVSAGLGIAHFHDTDLAGRSRDFAMSYKEGAGESIAVGYAQKNYRVEAEYSHRSALAGKTLSSDGNERLAIDSYMVNLFYDWLPEAMIVPYAGIGMGVVKGAFNYTSRLPDNSIANNESFDSQYGYQVTAGVSGAFSENCNLDFYYRYHAAVADFNLPDVGSLPYSSSNLMVGLRFRFY